MRLNRTAIVGALIFAALFGGYKFFDFAGDTAHPFVPPMENADGKPWLGMMSILNGCPS